MLKSKNTGVYRKLLENGVLQAQDDKKINKLFATFNHLTVSELSCIGGSVVNITLL